MCIRKLRQRSHFCITLVSFSSHKKGLKTMKINRQYLWRRPSGTYYLRVQIPKGLRETLGQTEITKSLATKDLKIAERHSIFLSRIVKHLFFQENNIFTQIFQITTKFPNTICLFAALDT